MKTYNLVIIGIILFLLILLNCEIIEKFTKSRDQIKIVGSSTVYPYAIEAAERFRMKYGFKEPVIESIGTGGGAKLFCAGVGVSHPDITNASRPMNNKEKELCKANGVDFDVFFIDLDGITLAYSVDAEPVNFTKEQLWKALAKHSVVNGKLVDNIYKTWDKIDPSLPKQEISVIIPPLTSGTRDALNLLVMKKGMPKEAKALYKAGEAGNKKYKKPEKLYREDGAAIEAGENDYLIIEKLSEDKEMFGFIGFKYFLDANDKLQAASIEGIQPSLESIQDYSYALTIPLLSYVKKAHSGVIPGLDEFVKLFTKNKAIVK